MSILNSVTIGVGIYEIFQNPSVIDRWQSALFANHSNPLMILGISALLFPKLALGLSGFETGVAIMPLVEGHPDDTEKEPRGRIANTYKLLTTAAAIMSFFLIASSLVTTLLIPAAEYEQGGKANGRALAYRILRARSAAVPNAIAAILLEIRDRTEKIPHAYFGWLIKLSSDERFDS